MPAASPNQKDILQVLTSIENKRVNKFLSKTVATKVICKDIGLDAPVSLMIRAYHKNHKSITKKYTLLMASDTIDFDLLVILWNFICWNYIIREKH